MGAKKYFGTDGIRGEVGQSLINAEFVLKLGWAAGKVLGQKETEVVLIGKDTRVSGYMLESALQAGLLAAGIDILLLGPMPTPAIAYLTHSIRASAGIVISASHNLYQDNGIKFFDKDGFKLSDELELAIEAHIDSSMQTVPTGEIGKAARMVDAQGRYIEFCKSTFPSSLSLRKLKIIIDCANGATYQVAPSIFHELGADVIAIANKPDGFNINKQCGATDVNELKKAVLAENADLGIAFDGDGDRVIMVDNKGTIVDGDVLLCILAIDRARQVKTKMGIVGTVMSNLGLERTLQQHNIIFERASVGDRHVLERLQQNGWVLGGEASGHIVDLNYTTTGDGIITALQILKIMQVSESSLFELTKIMEKSPQMLINIPIKQPVDLKNCPHINNAITQAEKMLAGMGRVLLRASGTEPLIRVMVEGQDEKLVKSVAESLASTVETWVN